MLHEPLMVFLPLNWEFRESFLSICEVEHLMKECNYIMNYNNKYNNNNEER